MEKHKILLGAIYVVFGAFTVIASLAIITYITLHGGIVQNPEAFYDILKLIVFISSIIFLLISISGIVGGIGLLSHKSWARSVVLVTGFFYLFFIPLGTFLSMYTILVLMRDQVALLFTSPLSAALQGGYKKEYTRQPI